METTTLAGGCFWCTEAIFKRLKGIQSVVSGYSGGNKKNPTYDEVCTGKTGHAEALQITFDPHIISYEKLLEIFFHLHDPTTLNRQGNDVGIQYRSAIFYHNEKQREIALQVKQKAERSQLYKNPIVTQIVPYTNFYTAESYHQNYYDSNRDYPYCTYVIDPKIKKLMREFPKEVKETA